MRISPSAGTGTGRSSTTSVSGPPGSLIAIARMLRGSAISCPLDSRPPITEPADKERRRRLCSPPEDAMTFLDDDRPRKKPSPQPGENLAELSIEELKERIALYRGEIERLEQDIAAKEKFRTTADTIFRR